MRPNPLAALVLVSALSAAGAGRAEPPPCEHCAGGAAAHADHAAPRASAAAPDARVEVPDVTLVDQDGSPVALRAALAGDALVVVDFVFTSCTTVCPVLSAILTRVQDALGERAGSEVRLVTLSLDPARDTPARMKAFGARFRAGPAWSWLTGEREVVERALKGLGGYSADFTAHPPFVLVGDGRAGRWVRLNGFPKQQQILAQLDALRSARAGLGGKE